MLSSPVFGTLIARLPSPVGWDSTNVQETRVTVSSTVESKVFWLTTACSVALVITNGGYLELLMRLDVLVLKREDAVAMTLSLESVPLPEY